MNKIEAEFRKRFGIRGKLTDDDYASLRRYAKYVYGRTRSRIKDCDSYYAPLRVRGPYWQHIDDPEWYRKRNAVPLEERREAAGEFLGRKRKKLEL